MSYTLLFNPDNDLALANGNDNYLPPRSAVRMAYDLSLLPIWWADNGDTVLVPDSSLPLLGKRIFTKFRNMPDLNCITWQDDIPLQAIFPWGWNPALVKRFSHKLEDNRILPSPVQMKEIRRLSGRQTAICILQTLMNNLSAAHPLVGEATLCTSTDEVKAAISRYPTSLLKAPWSGSGKGLRRTSGTYEPPFSGWCQHIIDRQGSVVVEPLYNKVKDFAMEFYADGSETKLRFVGYSYFMTDANGAYEGNSLMSDTEIEHLLASYIPLKTLHTVREHLSTILSEKLSSHYRGYVGIDMMICQSDSRKYSANYLLHPCVEVNLRMNMGVVSHILFERYIAPGSHGRFMVEYFHTPADLYQAHESRMSASPLDLSVDGRIVSGYQPLTPIGPDTQYIAWMEIHPEQTKKKGILSYPTVLGIAGSDSSGGAGIQADIKTISALGVYAATAITSITVQDTNGVRASYPVSADVVSGQIKAVMEDLAPDAIKIGMIGNAEIVRAIVRTLSDYPDTPIIYDPVMVSTSGHPLMSEDAIEAVKQTLFPRCTLITPNLREAEVLTGKSFANINDMTKNIHYLRQWGSYAILLKGGHLEGEEMTDFLLMPDADIPLSFRSEKVDTPNTHGTGCTLSSAIAALCASGCCLTEAVRQAKLYVSEAIRQGSDVHVGRGHGPLNHFFSPLPLKKKSQTGKK